MDKAPIILAEPASQSLRHLRLTQIHRRDPQAEGRFWYSVVTTGVYCRPSCPSRQAQAKNIRLHETLAEARSTGFRPCGRCNPEQPSQTDRHRALVQVVCSLIAAGTGVVSSRALAEAVGLSPSQLHRVFRRVTGTTPSAYARSVTSASSSLGLVAAVSVANPSTTHSADEPR